ncbi:transposase, IS5 family [Burkholderiales bacterium GJ-E10]|nr:transposase, IS5 family [Burkholderiales bacterium GJ-E10]
MKQADLGLDLTSRKTRKGKFLDEMERVVPWAQLLALIEPHAPRKERGRPPFGAEVMLRIHFCSNGSGCRTWRWKRRCLTFRCTASLPGSAA